MLRKRAANATSRTPFWLHLSKSAPKALDAVLSSRLHMHERIRLSYMLVIIVGEFDVVVHVIGTS